MSAGADRLRLLLAEDEPLQRKICGHLLTRAGYEVALATSGEEALGQVLTGGFQILVTDWDMPGLDGATLCRQVREARLPGYLYIIMLTAHTGASDTVAGLEAGADDYVAKPADERELLARVKAGCRIVRLQRSLSEANARVEQLALTDALLGCYNRRYLNEQLPREIERSQRYQTVLALIMADLDAFKGVNDAHGHMVGDEVLVEFCRRSAAALRQSSDWMARFGGEEFAIVLPQTDLEGAAAVAEKVRIGCANAPFATSAGAIDITVSLGIAALSATTGHEPLAASSERNGSAAAGVREAVAGLLAQADAALYEGKHAGRNRTTVYGRR